MKTSNDIDIEQDDVDELIKMITYDPVKAEQEYLQYCKDNNISRPQKFDHCYKAPDKFRALELVLKYNENLQLIEGGKKDDDIIDGEEIKD